MDAWTWLRARSSAASVDDAWTQITSVSNTPTPPADAWDWLAIQSTATAADDAWVHLISILGDVVADTGEGIATLMIASMLAIASDKPVGTVLANDNVALLAQQPSETRLFADTKDATAMLSAHDNQGHLENTNNRVILN